MKIKQEIIKTISNMMLIWGCLGIISATILLIQGADVEKMFSRIFFALVNFGFFALINKE